MEAIRAWLEFFKVLQGFDDANRDAVAKAALIGLILNHQIRRLRLRKM